MKINVENGDIEGYVSKEISLEDVHDSQCTEILAPQIVNRIHYTQLQDTLKHWLQKLRIGGTVILGGYDAVEFSKNVINYSLSREQKNLIVSESGSFLALDEITELVKQTGFKVLKRSLNGISYTLELTKE
jgi:fumarate hydratase class II